MSLSDRHRDRLADIVELQPTKNGELQERWDMESGSEVHQYLETHLGDYYYRDDNSLIRATDEAAGLVDVEPGVEGGVDGSLVLRVPALERALIATLPEPDEETVSVVSAMQALPEELQSEVTIDEVREALQNLRRKEAVEVQYRLVPTFGLARPRSDLTVEAPARH